MKARWDLRLVLDDPAQHNGGRYALAAGAKLNGDDLYVWAPGLGVDEIVRNSQHASGQSHIHFHGGHRWIQPAGAPLRDTKGVRPISSWGVGPLDTLNWDYRPKPSKPRRVTETLNVRTLIEAPASGSEVWAIEAGRPDIVADALAELHSSRAVLLQALLPSEPVIILGFIWTLRRENWTNFPHTDEHGGLVQQYRW